jgi:hypothetical protein
LRTLDDTARTSEPETLPAFLSDDGEDGGEEDAEDPDMLAAE